MTSPNDNFNEPPRWIAPGTIALKQFAGQVAGHAASVYTSCDDLLLLKKCLKKEIEFYLAVTDKIHPAGKQVIAASILPCDPLFNETLERFAKYLPVFVGQTKLPSTNTADELEDALVIENITSSRIFSRPNTLDIKLGTQLWAEDDASQEKRDRMEKVSKETTSGETGIRLTGWQTHSTTSPSTIISTPKLFGKSISAQHLSAGLRLFFGIAQPEDAKFRETVLDNHSGLIEESPDPPKLNPKHVRFLLQRGLLPSLMNIRKVFEQLECRMRGGSLLTVFEGDQEVLTHWLADVVDDSKSDLPGLKPGQHLDDYTKQADLDKHQDKKNQDKDKRLKRLIDVRIIDFAHFKFCKGQGIDEGVLKGINSVITLVEGIVKEL